MTKQNSSQGDAYMEIKKNWNHILGLFLILILVYWTVNNIGALQGVTSIFSSAFMHLLSAVR